ncbi:Condensin complex subunit, partial [Tulasnella sp. 419]
MFNLQEELQALADPLTYTIANEVDTSDQDAISSALEHAVEAVATSPDNIVEQEVLDEYRSLLKHAQNLRGSTMSKMLDSITSGLQAEVDNTVRDIDADDQESFAMHRQTLDVYAFLLYWFASVAEKSGLKADDEQVQAAKPKRGKSTKTTSKKNAAAASEAWSWVAQIPNTLNVICKLLKIKSHRIWMSATDRDAFINCITRPAYHIMENEAYMKSQEVKLGVCKVICLAVKNHGHAFGAQISMMQCLQYFEHLAEPIAEILTILSSEYDHTQLTEEILREISAKNFSGQDTKGPRSFSRFLIRLADLSPKIVMKQMSLLLRQIDSESYPMRMALIEIIGALIKEIAMDEDPNADKEKKERKLNALFDLLFERFMDVNSYVRAKVINTLSKICELKVTFPKQRLEMTTHAIQALQDKSSSVRRYSIALLTKLISTHPFGIVNGGPLNLTEWEERYQLVNKELEALEKKMGLPVGGETQETQEAEEAEEAEEGDEDAEGEDEEDEEGEDLDETAEADEEEPEEGAVDEDEEDDVANSSPLRKKSKVKPQPSKKSKKSKKARRSSAIDVALLKNEQVVAEVDGQQHVKLKLTKKFVADALTFIRQIEGSIDVLSQLLVSTSKAEVLESMEFFKVAHDYEFEVAEVGIKKMLHLIWTKDNNSTSEDGKELKGVRSKLLEVYRALYFDPVEDLEPKQQINRIAKHMIERTYGATLAELTSLEELMRTMMVDGQIHPDVTKKLWHVYSVDKEIPRCQRRGAIIILGMIALAKKEVVTERLETLLRIGLGPLGKADLVLARYTCVALQRLSGSSKKVKGSLTDKNLRFPMDHTIFRKLQEAIEHPCKSRDWFGMAEQAINTIYLLGEQPDVVTNSLVQNFALRAFGKKQSASAEDGTTSDGDVQMDAADEATQGNGDPPSPAKTERTTATGPVSTDMGDSFQLSQLLFIVGHVAIKHVVYLELVERDLKRRKDEAAKEKRSKESGKSGKDTGEELDQVAGNAEDDIGDHIIDIREREMLYGPGSLLAVFGPMLVHICGTPKRFKDPILRTTATLSLSKFMCVSSRFCEENLLLLFKIFETSRDPTIRGNIVIALGDIAVCFNNMIDENSNNLYEGLTDKDLNVKKNTLMVLTHLILNGMIKVKGQLGEMAKCLEDQEQRIADLAKLFFTELSTKDNAIYNNLPDVISHLSVGEHAVDEDTFQSTMKYIFTFIEKEKQAENIVEKLCQRFRLTDEPRQWQDIAYCLSLLPFKSERSVKKLIEGLPFYQDKLHNEAVFNRFNEILSKARANKSSTKPDTELKEFETILQEFKEK